MTDTIEDLALQLRNLWTDDPVDELSLCAFPQQWIKLATYVRTLEAAAEYRGVLKACKAWQEQNT